MKFRVLLAVLLAVLAGGIFDVHIAKASPAGIFTCAFNTRDFIDPIVSPGVYPTEHMHDEAGGVNWTPTSTSADLRAGATTCAVSGDRAAYWIIAPTQDGQYVPMATSPKNVLVYYTCMHSASICANIDWFPENFGEIAGKSSATSVADNPVFNNGLGGYRCGIGGGTFYPDPPTFCSEPVVLGLTYGNCRYFDGHTDMKVNSNCTSAGGVPQIRRQQYWRFDPPQNDLMAHPLALDFDHPTYQLHADILDGFTFDYRQKFLDQCIRPKIACGTNPALAG